MCSTSSANNPRVFYHMVLRHSTQNPTSFIPRHPCKIILTCNAESAVLANDLKSEGFTIVSLDTGWVRIETGSNSSEAFGGAPPLDVLTSVAGQQKIIMALTPDKTGQYLNWNGEAPQQHPSSHSFVTAAASAAQFGRRHARHHVRMLHMPCKEITAKLAL